jgi:hypothetical protein
MIPAIGIDVIYKNQIGTINFVHDHYITICIRQFKERSRNVCIVVHRENYKQIQLLKESQK